MCWHSWREFILRRPNEGGVDVRVCDKCGKVQFHCGFLGWEAVSGVREIYEILHVHLNHPQAECYEKLPVEQFTITRDSDLPEAIK